MDIKNIAVEETAFLHLRDANDELLYEGGEPVGITFYGPGSKTFAKANQKKNNRLVDRLKKRGKTDTSPEEQAEENAAFLAEVTKEFHHIASGDLKGEELFKAVYANPKVGFIPDQAAKFLGEWGNFKKASTTT